MNGPLLAKARFRENQLANFTGDAVDIIIIEIDVIAGIVLFVDPDGFFRRIPYANVEMKPDIKVTRLAGVPAGGILPH